MRKDTFLGAALILALAALTGVALWQTAGRHAGGRVAVTRHPERIMGTTCTLAAVVNPRDTARAEDALRRAESVLRAVEARMSVWLADSEISRLNAASAAEQVPLSRDTVAVLRAARDAADQTGGAFDATIGPLIELWKRAAERDRVPTQAELDEARAASHWDLIELTDAGAVKRGASARVDLGGIAKGYAIDRAAQALHRAGVAGGLVDLGGDLKCFGEPPDDPHWTVEVKNPFGATRLNRLRLAGGAVCTSGSYARFTVIEGERYSHIIDPRTGRPADAAPSVTVIARSALSADIWATALSVTGPHGFKRLPKGVEALIVAGTGEDHRILCTDGCRPLFMDPLPRVTPAGSAPPTRAGSSP